MRTISCKLSCGLQHKKNGKGEKKAKEKHSANKIGKPSKHLDVVDCCLMVVEKRDEPTCQSDVADSRCCCWPFCNNNKYAYRSLACPLKSRERSRGGHHCPFFSLYSPPFLLYFLPTGCSRIKFSSATAVRVNHITTLLPSVR